MFLFMKFLLASKQSHAVIVSSFILLYINDLENVLARSIIHHFAEDINLIFLRKR